MGLFDGIRKAVETTAGEAADAAGAVGDAVADAAADAADSGAALLDQAPPPPTDASFDAGFGAGSPILNVGAPDMATQAPEWQPIGHHAVQLGPAEITVDTSRAEVGAPTLLGGTVVQGGSVTVGVDAPGVDASLTGESVFTVNPMVEGIIPKVGGPGFGASGEVQLEPDQVASSFAPPSVPEVPATPPGVPIPYPNLAVDGIVGAVRDTADEAIADITQYRTEVAPVVYDNAMRNGEITTDDQVRDGSVPGLASLSPTGETSAPSLAYPEVLPNPVHPGADFPVPRPNLGGQDGAAPELAMPDMAPPDMEMPDIGPLTVSQHDDLGDVSVVPPVGAPHQLAASNLETPIIETDVGQVDVATVEPGDGAPGATVGDDDTFDAEPINPPDVEVEAPADDLEPMSPPDDFASQIDAIDDMADDLDIFD